MSSFTVFDAALDLTYRFDTIHKKDSWVILTGFSFYLKDNPFQTVTVPKGFITDGASVPSWLQWLLPPWGEYGQAAVLHDYLLQVGEIQVAGNFHRYCVSRKEARKHFKDALEALNVPDWQRNVLMLGVTIWDWFKGDSIKR